MCVRAWVCVCVVVVVVVAAAAAAVVVLCEHTCVLVGRRTDFCARLGENCAISRLAVFQKLSIPKANGQVTSLLFVFIAPVTVHQVDQGNKRTGKTAGNKERQFTYHHPNTEPNPSHGTQLQHQVDIHQTRKGWHVGNQRHLGTIQINTDFNDFKTDHLCKKKSVTRQKTSKIEEKAMLACLTSQQHVSVSGLCSVCCRVSGLCSVCCRVSVSGLCSVCCRVSVSGLCSVCCRVSVSGCVVSAAGCLCLGCVVSAAGCLCLACVASTAYTVA